MAPAPVNTTAKERADDLRKNIQTVKDFMKAIEGVGGKVPDGLKNAVNRYTWALEKGADVGEEAEQVSIWLKKVTADMYAVCDQQPEDDAIVCKAGIDHNWQYRNLDAVLNWNNDESLIKRLWRRWGGKLADIIQAIDKWNANKKIKQDPGFTIKKGTPNNKNGAQKPVPTS
jgi:hypothetical protein